MSRMRYRTFVTLLAAGAALATAAPATAATPASGAPAPAVAAMNADSCSVRFEPWPGGYTTYVTVTGPAAGWSIPFTVPSGQQVIQAWSANVSVGGQNGTASSMSWNGNLGSGQSVTFGLITLRPGGDTRLLAFPTCT
jgi:endoglucanase